MIGTPLWFACRFVLRKEGCPQTVFGSSHCPAKREGKECDGRPGEDCWISHFEGTAREYAKEADPK